jgi:RHS repeat-associated protein
MPGGVSGTYNSGGQLTSTVKSSTTTGYTYNADGQRLTEASGGTTLVTGNWNGAGDLTSYDNTAANLSAATYDGQDIRASDTVSGASQTFAWDTSGKMPQLLMDGANAYIYGDGGTPAEQVNLATGTIRYLVADALGSVRGIVSSAGALTATTGYDAFGNPLTSGGLTATTPFGYAGGYTDPTGLIYLLNRYYDPATAQFISVDAAIRSTDQPYQYASGNPVNKADPTGNYTQLITHWTVLSNGQTGSGALGWRVPSNAPYIDYRVSSTSSFFDEECSGTDNTIGGSLEVGFPVLEATLGLSFEASHGWNNSSCIGIYINVPRNGVGWPEWRWTWQNYTIVQQKWECVQTANSGRCSHFPRFFEASGTATIHVHVQSHPQFRFGQCVHVPRSPNQQCPPPA